MLIRLQKYLSSAGAASRRAAETMIASGRVAVNGNIITEQGVKVDASRDIVELDGKTVSLRENFSYIILHKPEGVVTTVSDPQGRQVVTDLIPGGVGRVFPVGRLDYGTSGLLILTDDGEFANALAHPRNEAEKVYAARLLGVPDREAVRRFKSGIMIEGRRTLPCGIKITGVSQGPPVTCKARITLKEGRNRQIRRMCEAIGHPVLSLKRVKIGTLDLGDLPKGNWRRLTEAEINELKAYTNRKERVET